MNGRNLTAAALGGTALGSAVLAGLIVWLWVTEPTTVATAMTGHDLTQMLHALITALSEAVAGFIRYL
jgi:hypothetical protein